MVVDVIEAFRPSLQSAPLNLDDVFTKAAPEPTLTVAADSAAIQFEVDHSCVANAMVL